VAGLLTARFLPGNASAVSETTRRADFDEKK
jgi:hypothetical protein